MQYKEIYVIVGMRLCEPIVHVIRLPLVKEKPRRVFQRPLDKGHSRVHLNRTMKK